MEDSNALYQWVIYFILLLSRMSAFFVLSPVFGRQNIPTNARVILSIAMTGILLSLYPVPADLNFISFWDFLLVLLLEIAVGLIMGFINSAFFSSVLIAGQYIDMQIGFSMVTILDPATNVQTPIVGSLLNIALLESFLISNGHLILVRHIYRTYEILPAGNINFSPSVFNVMLEGFVISFLLGLQIALPIIVGILLADVALGLLVRVSPQMNVFVVGIGLKSLLGLIILFAMIPVFIGMTKSIFDQMYYTIDQAFLALRPI